MWGAIITVALQLVGYFLNKSAVSEANKKRFFELLKLASQDLGSVKLMGYADKQLQWFKDNPEWKESTI